MRYSFKFIAGNYRDGNRGYWMLPCLYPHSIGLPITNEPIYFTREEFTVFFDRLYEEEGHQDEALQAHKKMFERLNRL